MDLPENIEEARVQRRKDLKMEFVRDLKPHIFKLLIPDGLLGQVDIALRLDKKSILREALSELSNMLDKYTYAEAEENIEG